MLPAISQVCTLPASFEQDIADYAAAKCGAVELWLTKLETYLESHSLEDVRHLLREHDISAPVASYQGGLLASQGLARQTHWEHFARRLELCAQLGIGTLVMAADIQGPMSQPDFERVRFSLSEAARAAQTRGIRLALEFRSSATFCNNLQTAAMLVAEAASPHVGLCLDVFHFYLGPSKTDDLDYLTRDNLFHVQICDLADVPRELASDSDRILPGDGDFQFQPLLAALRRIGYEGVVSLEVMNPQFWRSPRQLAEIGMTSLRKLLGQASMGLGDRV